MIEALNYPFDGSYLLKKRKSLRRQLLADGIPKLKKKIAVLGGSTTHDIKQLLELFLLNQGIEPEFYESEYNKYWEDAMFSNPELDELEPDLIYIHTTSRNIQNFPDVSLGKKEVLDLLDGEYFRFEQMWTKLRERFSCPVIQNNFELPSHRLFGNSDGVDCHGKVYFIEHLNQRFQEYAETHSWFYINDICWISANYGLKEWSDPYYWYMYKYSPALPAVPDLAFNLSNIMKSIYGKNKKALVLDLDNTLWGGIVGDDGPENIEIGEETPVGQVYAEFQSYLKQLKKMGILLTIDSKNTEEVAVKGLERPDSVLSPDDFLIKKINWMPKDRNLTEIAQEINIGRDSLVFVDDNPAERHIVKMNVPEVSVPEIGKPEQYIQVLDRSGFFEVTAFTGDDLARNEMYKANLQRQQQKASFSDYNEYLTSLEMEAEIDAFDPMYFARIAQLTNKSNQFNLTTKRCSVSDIENITADSNYITLYLRLKDRFGDNGVVSIMFGHKQGEQFHIDLWLMSCRVLKRDVENVMMDVLIEKCRENGLTEIVGYYYPTAKNGMVKDFYGSLGFTLRSRDEEGSSIWIFDEIEQYKNKNKVIKVGKKDEQK